MINSTSKILVVDDEPATRTLIYRFFSQKNYHTESAGDAKTAISVFERFFPDLVIMDVNLPDATGYSLCKEMQRRTNVFVILLTSRSDPKDKVIGFEEGADDYLTKPFDLQELQYRVMAILRRQRPINTTNTERLIVNQLAIDPLRREVTLKDKPILLTALEFDILHFLASHPNQVWRREQLLQHIWGSNCSNVRLIDTHLSRIRRKIEIDGLQPSFIHSVRAVGFKFEMPSNLESQI